jgi:hypothetical protein
LCDQLRVDKVKARRKGILNVTTEVIKHHELQIIQENFLYLTIIMCSHSDIANCTLSSYGRIPKKRKVGIPKGNYLACKDHTNSGKTCIHVLTEIHNFMFCSF